MPVATSESPSLVQGPTLCADAAWKHDENTPLETVCVDLVVDVHTCLFILNIVGSLMNRCD
jgi:hypothetical protein